MGFCDAARSAEMITGKLKRCAKCGEPKEFHAVLFGKDKIFSCPCRCELAAAENLEAEERRKEKEKAIEVNRRKWIPKALRGIRFGCDDHADPVAGAVVRNYYRKFDGRGGLLVYGPEGTGKTFFAMCVANHLITDGKDVIYISAPRVAFWDDVEKKIEQIRKAELVILDDFGAEGIRAKGAISVIIDARYNDQKALIVTTNLTPSELKAGGRTTSRLFEMCYPIPLSGPDRRKLKMKERVEKARRSE